MLRRLKLRIPEYTTLTHDEFWRFVIKRIDGTTTVEAIGITLREKFGSSVEPLYERLIPYMKYIG